MKALLNTSIKLVAALTSKNLLDFEGTIDFNDLLNSEIEYNTNENNISFENASARSNFYNLVKSEIKSICPKVYNRAFPPVQMDQFGNYTTDSSKWV